MEAKQLFPSFTNTLSPDAKDHLLEELLFNDLVGVNITDASGQSIFLNDAHTRITGQPKSMYLENSMPELEAQGRVTPSAVVRVLESKKSATVQQTVSGGKTFEVRGIPVYDDSGKLLLIICLLTDVTEIVNSKKRVEAIEKYVNTLRQAITSDGRLVYQSRVMQKVVEKAKRIAETDVSVLITGPSGVGKEMIADIIHENSARRDKPFIKINCAAIPENLLESELFGYEPGAFTGGSPKGKKGLIESANGGTLLLDEIGELPLMLQSKLLRTLQARTIRHLGGTEHIKVDFRLISSTNADLFELVQKKEFRDDLFYRVNVIEIPIPPLENRKEDIPLLIHHFIRLFNAKYERNLKIDTDAVAFLSRYNYPGNVRELRNIVERLIIQSPEEVITVRDAYEAMGNFGTESGGEQPAGILPDHMTGLSLKQIMENYERNLLQDYIRIYRNGSELAKHLRTDQSTISRKLNKYGIRY